MESEVKSNLKINYKICNLFSWLLDSYVMDFFVNDLWKKLPKTWQEFFNQLPPYKIAKLLDYNESLECDNIIWPLSVICLKKLLIHYCLPRQQKFLDIYEPEFFSDKKIMKLFWKNVKLKKRHEIEIFSKISFKLANDTNCHYIVDIGAGLGHLSRVLNYGYNLNICTIEAQEILTEHAKKLDLKFEQSYRKKSNKIIHINMKIDPSINSNEFLKIVQSAFNIKTVNDFKFGVVGLHPCGDLGPMLLRLFKECDHIQFVNIVGCCYMKLSDFGPNQGFPLSNFCKINNLNFSYTSKEVACHAIENYIEKLMIGECWKLKIHTYRALIEKIIINIKPNLYHSSLTNIKYSEDLNFSDYCRKAVEKIDLVILEDHIKDVSEGLCQWQSVVAFYSIRLLLAPLIETIILWDRLLFILESGFHCEIIPAFNGKISPRNHVMICYKTKVKNTVEWYSKTIFGIFIYLFFQI